MELSATIWSCGTAVGCNWESWMNIKKSCSKGHIADLIEHPRFFLSRESGCLTCMTWFHQACWMEYQSMLATRCFQFWFSLRPAIVFLSPDLQDHPPYLTLHLIQFSSSPGIISCKSKCLNSYIGSNGFALVWRANDWFGNDSYQRLLQCNGNKNKSMKFHYSLVRFKLSNGSGRFLSFCWLLR